MHNRALHPPYDWCNTVTLGSVLEFRSGTGLLICCPWDCQMVQPLWKILAICYKNGANT